MAGPSLRSLWSTTRKSLSTSTYYSSSTQSTLRPYHAYSRAFSSAPATAPTGALDPSRIRNVAVIAQGKTTLMDRLSLERERGIAIASKSASCFVACRRLSTSVLTPESSDGAFPSHLLSTKRVITPEHTQGQCQDLVIPVTNFHNEDKGFMVLAGDVFDVPIRKDIVHRVVRWQLLKRQQGTHSTKTISEVSGTGRKPWKQKGTGRARHGTLRGPQFRGGAIMHGPKPRSHAIKLNKKVRRLGLKITLSARAAEGKLIVFDDLEVPTHKTKNIVNYVNQMENAKKLLLVDGGPVTEKLKLATQNLHYVNILPSIGLNVYSILLHDTLVMSRDAVNRIVERMHTPINR